MRGTSMRASSRRVVAPSRASARSCRRGCDARRWDGRSKSKSIDQTSARPREGHPATRASRGPRCGESRAGGSTFTLTRERAEEVRPLGTGFALELRGSHRRRGAAFSKLRFLGVVGAKLRAKVLPGGRAPDFHVAIAGTKRLAAEHAAARAGVHEIPAAREHRDLSTHLAYLDGATRFVNA